MGPQRAGTSWVDAYLRQRGDVCLPAEVKETFFFDRKYDRGAQFYTAHFSHCENHKITSEVTTTAFDHTDAPKRVKEMFGNNVKLICPLRDPVRRSYSLYKHALRHGFVSGTLQEACAQKPEIVESSHYAAHLRRWLDVFPKENFHFMFQEDLELNRDQYVQNLCAVLGIDYKPVPENLKSRVNVTTTPYSNKLASIGQRAGDFLRDRQLYWVVNAAKNMGLKQIIFGAESADPLRDQMPMEDFLWLDERLAGEVDKLERLIGPINAWYNQPKEKTDAATASQMVRPSYSPASGRAA